MSKQRCYKPDGMSMWDTWCVEHDGVAHMYYLQFHEPGSPRPGNYACLQVTCRPIK